LRFLKIQGRFDDSCNFEVGNCLFTPRKTPTKQQSKKNIGTKDASLETTK